MPRVSSLRQLDRANLTPFARLVYDYLLSVQPTKLVSELAEESGVSNNAIWSWLKHGITPRRQTIVQLAERVPDLAPLDDLLAAAALPSTAEMRVSRRAEVARFEASVALFERLIQESDDLSDETKRAVAQVAQRIRTQPDVFLRATDTYREYNDPSPAQVEAERGLDDALVYEPEPITSPEQAHGQRRPTPHPQPRSRRPSGV